jgi:hypothetical protein
MMHPLGLFHQLAPENIEPGQGGDMREMLAEVQPETARLQGKFEAARQTFDDLGKVKRALGQQHSDLTRKLNTQALDALDELVDSPAADVNGLSESLEAVRRAVNTLADALDHITWNRLPGAELTMFQFELAWKRNCHLEALLIHGSVKSDLMEAASRHLGAFGKVLVASEHLATLEQAATEAGRQAQASAANLDAYKSRRETIQSARFATQQVTRAEALAQACALQGGTQQ